MKNNNWVLWALIVVCLLIVVYALARSYQLGANSGHSAAAAPSNSG